MGQKYVHQAHSNCIIKNSLNQESLSQFTVFYYFEFNRNKDLQILILMYFIEEIIFNFN